VTRSRKPPSKSTARKPKTKERPKPRLASEVVEQARLAITARCRMTDDNAQATLVLFALARALKGEAQALARLAEAAREALGAMGEPHVSAAGVDELTHRRFVTESMSKMLVVQRDALARTDPRKPPPLPAVHMAKALSRMLASGPLRGSYESNWTPGGDGDAERILSAWTDCVAADGCVHVDGDPAALARKLVVQALVALGVPRQAALAGLARGRAAKPPRR
jgi:hypothetical protein